MNGAISLEKLRQRRKELVESVAREVECAVAREREAAEHRAYSGTLTIRLEEVEYLLGQSDAETDSENVIPMRKPGHEATKPSLRYRNPGATTDIVAMAYESHGIDYEKLVDAIYLKYRHEGTTKETVKKLIYRMIQEGYAVRKGNRLELTDICRAAWEASPLYKAS